MRSVIFYLRSPKATTSLIMMRAYDRQFAGGKFTYSTKEFINPKHWTLLPRSEKSVRKKPVANGAGRPKQGVLGNDLLETRLDKIKADFTSYMRENRDNDKFSSDKIRQHLDGAIVVEKRKVTIVNEWLDYLELQKPQVEKVTFEDYERGLETMKDFLKEEGKSTISAAEFDKVLFKKYLNFLSKKYPSSNTVAKKLKRFKMFVNASGVKLGMNPTDIKYRETPGIKISLSEEELEKLENLKLVGHLHNVRVLFLIQCNVGCRISDLFTLDKHISADKTKFEFIQKKTLRRTSVPITPLVRRYLEEYNYRLPHMADQTFNKSIKEVFKLVNDKRTIQVLEGGKLKTVLVWKEISSHDSVRTFVSISAARGMSIPDIAIVVGKSVSVLIKNYLVPSQKRAEEQMLEAWSSRKAS